MPKEDDAAVVAAADLSRERQFLLGKTDPRPLWMMTEYGANCQPREHRSHIEYYKQGSEMSFLEAAPVAIQLSGSQHS